MTTEEKLMARFALTSWQAETVLQAVGVIIGSHCWRTDTELEDMLDALVHECRDYEYEQFEKTQAEKLKDAA